MRRLTAALISAAAIGAFSLGTASVASADPETDAIAAAEATAVGGVGAEADVDAGLAGADASITANYRYVSYLRCRLGGGRVIWNWRSPTRLSCWGGVYHGAWVYRFHR
ncbi:hypothetical protein HII36_33590 [Nonomuraea sp. NN258]|uniref:hypothetical protein n=1 Tax=Nonomuraea antri TaxID=2730852 RepID=UPI001568AD50|nr:hypothetical protein [Nonomuraea antri]NRQ36734.1 hypothetical protein [Nonomuraea antri]